MTFVLVLLLCYTPISGFIGNNICESFLFLTVRTANSTRSGEILSLLPNSPGCKSQDFKEKGALLRNLSLLYVTTVEILESVRVHCMWSLDLHLVLSGHWNCTLEKKVDPGRRYVLKFPYFYWNTEGSCGGTNSAAPISFECRTG